MRTASLLLCLAASLASRSVAADRAAARSGPTLPNVLLRTQDNKPVRFYDDLIKGKTVVISFMFTSCKAICPMTNVNLLKVQKALGGHMGRDVFFYSLTLDHKTDTPEVLHKYAKAIGAKPGWTFLTGRPRTWNRSAANWASPIRILRWMPTRLSTAGWWSTATTPQAGG